MTLQLQDFTTLVRGMAAGVQGASRQLLDLTVGSVLRAVLEANASVALWLQWLIVQVLATTRAATSSGPDLDSWMADFSLARLPAVPASGLVEFSRLTPGVAAFIPIGTQVRTSDGSQIFAVTADSTNPSWQAGAGGYVIPSAALSALVPVQAVKPGAAGNVQAGAISLLAAALPGVDTVTNPGAFVNGVEAESDSALRKRFQDWCASLARATTQAVAAAVRSVQQNLNCVITEGVDASGSPRPGSFVVIVDDGSGTPPAPLLASVATAVEAVRPVGTTYAILPPTVIPVAITLTLSIAQGANTSQVVQQVTNAISTWVNSLTIGAALPLTRIAALAYAASPEVIGVSGVMLNGGAADITPPSQGVIKMASLTVS